MKSKIILLSTLFIGLTLGTVFAQPGGPRGAMGGPPQGPQFGGYMARIFGDHPNFSADMEFQVTGDSSGDITMPGKFVSSEGKTRFEMNMSEMKTSKPLPPKAMEHMKQMGMDKYIMISRPDKKTTYVVMDGMKAYLENPMQDPEAAKPASDYKMDVTKIGEETISGHSCIKNKVVTTDANGASHEATIWNATDLHDFPLKVASADNGKTMVMLFKNVKMDKPEASQFEPPSDYKKYSSYMELIMGSMQIPPH
jgi:Domain of unknown function (DUF4412)